MFGHLYQYRLKKLFRSRAQLFWTGLFPIILGTLFYVSFGKQGLDEQFTEIPVAVVMSEESEESEHILSVLEEMKTGDTSYFQITETKEEKAKKLLEDGKVDGLIQIGTENKLMVLDNGLNQTIIKAVLDGYEQSAMTIQAILEKNPQAVQQAAQVLTEDSDFVEQINFNGKETNMTISYFYALIAMAVGYGSFFGMINAGDIQADQSAEAARRNIAPVHKLKAILADFMAALTVQFILFLVVYGYIQYVLGMDFSIGTGYVMLIGLTGSMVGVAWGYFIGIFPGLNDMMRDGILSVSTLFASFLAGLMVGDMKQIVEEHCPIINRINPPSLISDAFYYAGIYNDYSQFYRCIITLAVIAALLCVGAYLGMRRQRYASL